MQIHRILHLIPIMAMVMMWVSCEEPCPPGYYGELCEIKEYDKFLGEYRGTVNCGAGKQATNLSIMPEPLSPPFNVIINLDKSTGMQGFHVKALVLQDTIFVMDQVVKIAQTTDTVSFNFFTSKGLLTSDTSLMLQLILSTELAPNARIPCQYELLKN